MNELKEYIVWESETERIVYTYSCGLSEVSTWIIIRSEDFMRALQIKWVVQNTILFPLWCLS